MNVLTPKNAFDLLVAGDAVLIDVREPDEFKEEHIVYGLSIPLSMLETQINQLAIPADKKLLFQCFKGSRGEQACAFVNRLNGIDNDIFNIEGGITGWKAHKLPTVKSTASHGVSIFRQVQMVVGALIALCIALGILGMSIAFFIAGLFALALFFAGVTGWCGMASLLRKMPWNK